MKYPAPNSNALSSSLQNTLSLRLLLRHPVPPTTDIGSYIHLSSESNDHLQSVLSISESNESLCVSVSKSKYKKLENKSKIANKLMY